MKYIDAFLKKLKTDRNTFATYILTLISVYIVVDRLVEILFIGATGMSVSYWGPIKYTLAMMCPVFALQFSFASKFVTDDEKKLSFLYIFIIGFYIIVISMIIQWINKICWILFFSVPRYSYIIQNFYELVKPAFSTIAWYVPIVTFYPLFKKCYTGINDTKAYRDSVFDYPGIDLSDKKEGWGPYTCELFLFRNSETGQDVKLPEIRRFESMFICGVSGSGKTSMLFEPFIARDIEKKYFFREASKEAGYAALRTGIASINTPYSNEYINANFNLNMIKPNPNKEKLYKAFLNKLILSQNENGFTYKNLGLTYVAPDYETIEHMKNVADNFGFKYKVVDPNDPNSAGLNPFSYKDPVKAALAVSAIIQRVYGANLEKPEGGTNMSTNAPDFSLATQAIENLVILLRLIFPKINDGIIPNLEDLLNVINNFDLVEKMTKVLEKDEELSKKYSIQIEYFKKTFFKNAPHRSDIDRQLKTHAAVIEGMLKFPGVKNVLCNRTNNVNYDDALANGDIVFVCTRRGDLGASAQKAFGLFFLLLMQQSVLSRPGTERTRTPYFLYIDEFQPFINNATQDIFTLYRKYRVGVIVSAQNLAQLGDKTSLLRQTLLANCSTKIVFGNNTPEDNQWWSDELSLKRDWKWSNDYHSNGSKNADGQPGYDENYKSIVYGWKKNFETNQLQALKFKQLAFKTRDIKGKMLVGKAKVDFLESRYKEPQKVKSYNFTKFVQGVSTKEEEKDERNARFDLGKINFSSNEVTQDGPILRNSSGNSMFNKLGSKKSMNKNEIDPVKINNDTNSAIDDHKTNNNNNDENNNS